MRYGWSVGVAGLVAVSLGCVLGACSASSVGTGAPAAADTPNGATDPGSQADAGAGPAEASADAASQSCTRAAQAKTAPTSLFDAFTVDLATLGSDAARAARVDKLLADVAAAGGTPLEEPGSDRVVFLARGAAGGWSVGGSFNGWTPASSPMQAVPGTDLWVLDAKIARGKDHAYKLVNGGAAWKEDKLARNVVWDGIDHKTVGEMNAVVHGGDAAMTRGRLVAHRGVHATGLGDDRDVFVYLPPKFDDGSCGKLPHLVVHDGNESLTRGDFAGAADAVYAARPELSAELVFVALSDQNVRMDEYTFHTATAKGDAYGDFLVRELEPLVEKSYRVCSKASARGLSGASLGGLISTYLAFQRSDVWGFVGAQSSSYFWDNDWMITRAGQEPKVAVRIYLDHGCPNDNCDENRLMTQQLTAKGYEQKHVEDPGAEHDWAYWRARLPQLLTYFRDGRTDCD